jgi:hypothetical protein
MCSLYNWLANIFGNIRLRPQTWPPAADVISPHLSKLTLPTFWISELAAWFALAEAKFGTSNITNQRVMFYLLVAALPEKNLSQVMDIIKNIPAINPCEVLKLRLLEARPRALRPGEDGRSFPAGAPRRPTSRPSSWPLCCQCTLQEWRSSRVCPFFSCSTFPRRLGHSLESRSAATSAPWRL